ncbi:MAG: cellulase family glycosylhydrolase [Chitinivibrionales bacterium]|nr:cellulase family glycosylhydrolase [Chitinivibrionales bacterium]
MHDHTRSRRRGGAGVRALLLPALLTLLSCDYLYFDFERLSENPVKAPPFIDASGRICIYHGVNVSNYAKHAPGFMTWHTKEDFARLREWGFNIVRYLVFWEGLEPTPGTIDTAYLNAVLLRVQWLDELGIDVVLDMHQDLYSSSFGGSGFPPWTVHGDTTDYEKVQPWYRNYLHEEIKKSFRAFWSSESLRSAYCAMLEVVFAAAEPYDNIVGVDIMNEPYRGDLENFEADVLSYFYQRVVDMVAAGGYTKKVIFEPSIIRSAGLQSHLSFDTDGRCAYAPHFYDILGDRAEHYGSTSRLIMEEAMFMRVEEAARLGSPLLFGEYGLSPAVRHHVQYLKDFLAEADKHLAGRIYWAYDHLAHSEYGIIDNAGNPQPNMDALVRVYPQRIMGRDPDFALSENSFSLTYTRIDGSAPTEVFVPTRLTNVQVTVNGLRRMHSGSVFTYHNDDAPQQRIVITWE